MRLKFRDRDNQVVILEWRSGPKGVELVATGPGFAPGGFSLGFYSPRQLQDVLDRFTSQKPIPKREWASYPLVHLPIYTFTKPVRFAPRQGHETRLAIHASEWEEWDLFGSFGWPPSRTVTFHEQGERSWWRWLGRYRFWDACEFLKHGVSVGIER